MGISQEYVRGDYMLICISSTGDSLGSTLDPRFGRAAYFVFYDTEAMEHEIIENSAAVSGSGAGITSSQGIVDKGVGAVITGNMGPNAMNVLKAAEVKIYYGENISVKENIEKFQKNLLKEIDTTVPSHYGMGIKNE
jgi:predicted Fe-Mo cluster-binding NifX family protein